ncbi:SAV_2336 N-terminal domain-related protein [Streptomyces sp. NPDC057676]|uniref:SAV_2336 N-terminal domain-related protein n=1 Tax=Streptomyces sp. NPDC057676 TaxID=3346205 RepID=UPI0036C05B5E
MIDRLCQALVGAGLEPRADELLDVLWLGQVMARAQRADEPPTAPGPAPSAALAVPRASAGEPSGATSAKPSPEPAPEAPWEPLPGTPTLPPYGATPAPVHGAPAARPDERTRPDGTDGPGEAGLPGRFDGADHDARPDQPGLVGEWGHPHRSRHDAPAAPPGNAPAYPGSDDATRSAPTGARGTPEARGPRRALYSDGSQGGDSADRRARASRVPGGRVLPEAQRLARALRPLIRYHDHPQRRATDVEATVRLTAETGLFDLVTQAVPERALTAVLWVDRSPSMRVWHSLASEVRAALRRSGAFRSVRQQRFDPAGLGADAKRATSMADGPGTVVFVLTDGVHPAWRDPRTPRVLLARHRSGPVAVLHALPRRLWRGSGLDGQPRLLTATTPLSPAHRLTVTDPLTGERDPTVEHQVALPVIRLAPAALGPWVALQTRPGTPRHVETVLVPTERIRGPGAARRGGQPAEATRGAPPPSGGPGAFATPGASVPGLTAPGWAAPYGAVLGPDGAGHTARERIERFRSTFSPEAYRLAVRLSAIRPLTTPVMHLVRSAALPEATAAQVAEVHLGGLLTQIAPDQAGAAYSPELDALTRHLAPSDPVQPVYDFADGVRELLFSGLGVERSLEVAEAVGRALAPYLGSLPDFPALMADPQGLLRLHGTARAFAVLVGPVCERLGLPAPTPGPMAPSAPPRPPGPAGAGPAAPAPPPRPPLTPPPALPPRPTTPPPTVATPPPLPPFPVPLAPPPWPPQLPPLPDPYPVAREAALTAPRGAPGDTSPTPETTAPEPETTAPRPPTRPERAGRPEPRTTAPPVGVDRLRFELLGPVRAWRGEIEVSPGHWEESEVSPRWPRRRALLCLLLIRKGHPVTVAEAASALWGAAQPTQAQAVIHNYALQLRHALGSDALRGAGPHGYVLDAGVRTDIDACQRREAAADTALRRGERHRARALLDEALRLWGGDEPLPRVPGPYAAAQRARLIAWRLDLQERALGLDLALGHTARVVPELTALLARHPLHEPLHRLRMTALHRAGRTAEATTAYQSCQRLLAEELGMEPAGVTRDLYERILRGADLPAPDPLETRDPGPPAVSPLPAPPLHFVGRAAELAELRSGLRESGRPAPVYGIGGLSGIGKTALALQAAHELAPGYPDGRLFVDLRGGERDRPELAHVLGGLLRALGVPAGDIPTGTEARRARYQSLLEHRRVLVVIDRAHGWAQAAPLLPDASGCAALVTSRRTQAVPERVSLVEPRELTAREGTDLIGHQLGPAHVAADPDGAHRVVHYCHGLPLALHIAGRLARGQLRHHARPLTRLADRLAAPAHRLTGLRVAGLSVSAGFEQSYRQLDEAQQRALRLLSVLGCAEVSRFSSAALLDRPQLVTEDLLEALASASLTHREGRGRYRFNALVLLYAQRQHTSHTLGGAGMPSKYLAQRESTAAMARLVDRYLSGCATALRRLDPGDTLPHHLASRDTPLDRAAARHVEPPARWLHDEAPRLLRVLRHADSPTRVSAGVLHRLADLALAARALAEHQAYGRDFTEATESLVRAASGPHDGAAARRALLALAHAHNRAGRFGEAERAAARMMDHGAPAADRPDPVTQALAPHERALAVYSLGRLAEAEKLLEVAERAYQDDTNLAGLARVWADRSRLYLARGKPREACELAEHALAVARRARPEPAPGTRAPSVGAPPPVGEGLAVAHACYALGSALTAARRATDALGPLQGALDLFADAGLPLAEAGTRARLAEARLAVGDTTAATELADQAATAFGRHGGDWRRADALVVLGRALARQGRLREAGECWSTARDHYHALGLREARTVTELLADLTAGDPTSAGRRAHRG